MTDQSPESLFRQSRDRRDVEALTGVFDQVAPSLLRLARHLAPAGVEAEDLVQTTILVALEKPEAWDDPRPVGPWLAGILGRRALHERRRGTRIPEVNRLRAPSPIDPVAATLEREVDELLTTALARVPERYREVLEGRLVRGREASELAAELGRSTSTLHVQMHRGLGLLRRAPGPRAKGPPRCSRCGAWCGVRLDVALACRSPASSRSLGSSRSSAWCCWPSW